MHLITVKCCIACSCFSGTCCNLSLHNFAACGNIWKTLQQRPCLFFSDNIPLCVACTLKYSKWNTHLSFTVFGPRQQTFRDKVGEGGGDKLRKRVWNRRRERLLSLFIAPEGQKKKKHKTQWGERIGCCIKRDKHCFGLDFKLYTRAHTQVGLCLNQSLHCDIAIKH